MLTAILSVLGLGGIVGAGVAFPPFGALLLGVGRSAFGFLAKIPWQAYAIAALMAVLAFLTISRGHWIDRAHADEAQLAQLCQDVRTADSNPKLECPKAGAQILLLGQALEATTKAIGEQNAAIAALAKKTADEQKIATEAEKRASQRAGGAEAVAQRLDASSRSAPSRAAPVGTCAPSSALTEQWP